MVETQRGVEQQVYKLSHARGMAWLLEGSTFNTEGCVPQPTKTPRKTSVSFKADDTGGKQLGCPSTNSAT